MLVVSNCNVSTRVHPLQHGLQVLGHGEGSFRLALDLVDGDAIGDLDKGQAVGKVNVKDTLGHS